MYVVIGALRKSLDPFMSAEHEPRASRVEGTEAGYLFCIQLLVPVCINNCELLIIRYVNTV